MHYKSYHVNTASTPYYGVTYDSKSQPDKSLGIGHYKVMPNLPITLYVTDINGFPVKTGGN